MPSFFLPLRSPRMVRTPVAAFEVTSTASVLPIRSTHTRQERTGQGQRKGAGKKRSKAHLELQFLGWQFHAYTIGVSHCLSNFQRYPTMRGAKFTHRNKAQAR